MHDYSMRGHPRERLIFVLAAAAFSIMPLITTLSGWLGVGLAVTNFTIFGVLFVLFDRFVWRTWAVRRLFGLPDLNGKWICHGRQFDRNGNVTQEWEGVATIVQTWSRISVAIYTETSRSRSGPASIERDEGHGVKLVYTYQNEPAPGQPNLNPHRGTCELLFSEDCTEAIGTYFNDHNRRSFGELKLTRS
ncbi:MAG: hypothetical protein KatS3mg105_4945 [Gemmatales bacterium]|nr:MAG: hypothetical protein KatS3mg105_4945 [Gemmatales bacterium]